MTPHRHPAIGAKCTEIGPTACLTPTFHGEGAEEHLAGFFTAFDVADWPEHGDERAIGSLNVDPHFAGERPTWTMTGTLEGGDLTLRPSVRLTYRVGGDTWEVHGFVTGGKWEPV